MGNLSQNPEMCKFQTAVEIALVDEFLWNLRQNEALGWYFQGKNENSIFHTFYLLLSYSEGSVFSVFEKWWKNTFLQ